MLMLLLLLMQLLYFRTGGRVLNKRPPKLTNLCKITIKMCLPLAQWTQQQQQLPI